MSVTVEKIDVLSFVITGAERLDPVRVMIENYEPGKGRITITCYGKAWTAAWFAMGGDDVQTFIKRVSNEYLIGYFDPQLRSTVDDDNDANLLFVKSEIIKLRREREIDAVQAREMWDEAENADDVKESCCFFGVGNKLLNLFGDDPWYADWPTAPNPKYQYLERVLNAVRDGLKQIEKVEPVTVCLIDKRRRGQQIPSVEMPNHTWFCVLDIDGMDTLVDTRHYCDTATATPAKAKKMAALIENWTPPDGWCNGNDRDWHEKMKGYICDFLRKCNGFRVM